MVAIAIIIAAIIVDSVISYLANAIHGGLSYLADNKYKIKNRSYKIDFSQIHPNNLTGEITKTCDFSRYL